MLDIVSGRESLQNKKRITKIGAVEVCELEIGTHIAGVQGQFTVFCTVPSLFSITCM